MGGLALSACQTKPILVIETSSEACVLTQAMALQVDVQGGAVERVQRFELEQRQAPHRFVLQPQAGAPQAVTVRLRYLDADGAPLAVGAVDVALPQRGERCWAVFVPQLGSVQEARLRPCASLEVPEACALDAGPAGQDAGLDLGARDLGELDQGEDAGEDQGPSPDAGEDAGPWLDAGLGCGRPEGEFWRIPITISSGPDEAPAPYAVALRFDHRALVEAGLSMASGDDIQVLDLSGEVMHRVIDQDPAFGWNTEQTRIWFALEGGFGANINLTGYALLHGPTPAPELLDDPQQIFTSFSDMDQRRAYSDAGGNCPACISGATMVPGGARSGKRALRIQMPTSGSKIYEANDVSPEVGYAVSLYVLFDSFAPMSGFPSDRALALLRFESEEPAWEIELNLTVAGFYGLSLGQPTPIPLEMLQQGVWQRLELFAHPARGRIEVWVDGEQSHSTTAAQSSAQMTGVLFGLLDSEDTSAQVYFDDLLIRPWVASEPTATLDCSGL